MRNQYHFLKKDRDTYKEYFSYSMEVQIYLGVLVLLSILKISTNNMALKQTKAVSMTARAPKTHENRSISVKIN